MPGVQQNTVAGIACQMLPYLFSGEAKNGRKQAYQTMSDVVQRTLRRASWNTLGCGGIKPVLENIQIETAQIFGTEIMQSMHRQVKFVALIILCQFILKYPRERQHVAVNLQPSFYRHSID